MSNDSPVTVSADYFPKRFYEESETATTLIQIKHQNLSHDDETISRAPFLSVIGGVFRCSDDDRREGEIKLYHPTETDDDDDACSILRIKLHGVNHIRAYGGQYTYTGWITRLNFYPEGLPAETDDESFEYLPPEVNINGFNLPLYVEFTVGHHSAEYLTSLTD